MDLQYVKLTDGQPTTCITIDSSNPELISRHIWALWSTGLTVWNYNLETPSVILNLTMGLQRSCEESEIVFEILTGGCNMIRKCYLLEQSDTPVGTQCSWRCTCETTPCFLELMVIYIIHAFSILSDSQTHNLRDASREDACTYLPPAKEVVVR